MKKCFAWVLVLAMLLSMCGVVIAAEDAPVASAADVVIEPQNAAPAAQDVGECEAGSGETPTQVHTDHPVCGDVACKDHAAVEWTAWDGTGAVPTSGNVYLSGDTVTIELASAITVDGKTLNLCLNGHTITRSGGRPIAVKNGGTLNICDCSGSGAIVGKATTTARGGLIDITGKVSSVSLYHVALKNAKAAKDAKGANGNGGAIYVAAGSLNIVGGSIEGCEAAANGGAVYLAAGTSLMLDGVHISKCKGAKGSAIYIVNKADCTVKGGLIESGEASDSGAVYVENGGEDE